MVKLSDEYDSGFVLFAMDYQGEEDKQHAIAYCKENNLTPDDVKIVVQTKKNDEKQKFLLVIVK